MTNPFDKVNVSPDMARMLAAHHKAVNETLAQMLRAVEELHEASLSSNKTSYTRTYDECIDEIVKGNPIGMVLSCLFTAGYCEMWDFCDKVIGAK